LSNRVFVRYFFRVVFFSFLIFIEFLATTSKDIESVSTGWDKLNHLVAFFVLYSLFTLSYSSYSIKTKVTLLFFYGVQIEIVQEFLPYRFFSFYDVFANSIGIFIGVVFFYILSKLSTGGEK
jgi:VanZ family protein